ncbi:hypothetical protein IX39_07955 [Chryseobacterium formosense]|uniref:Uncharacterized protein n=1 Tax=Chryseobacterium formosense TaxID=236814 RepID=A0A085Z7Z9_9FLAO|nr:tetratricopeptide repeat protein [Chryseobacterium formosense]KFF00563.1 hypothetical protein IX39_07955 [Chryseobacterium formosense]SFT35084.1 Tetratricopeptide repeat-containing protein [Chryseobacterium formosense]
MKYYKVHKSFVVAPKQINSVEENVKMSPNNANAWDSLGEAYFINGDKENALKSYQKALELDPNSEATKSMIRKLETIK